MGLNSLKLKLCVKHKTHENIIIILLHLIQRTTNKNIVICVHFQSIFHYGFHVYTYIASLLIQFVCKKVFDSTRYTHNVTNTLLDVYCFTETKNNRFSELICVILIICCLMKQITFHRIRWNWKMLWFSRHVAVLCFRIMYLVFEHKTIAIRVSSRKTLRLNVVKQK